MVMAKLNYDGPIVLAVLDGVGLRTSRAGNAVRQAKTEFLDKCLTEYLNIPLRASGEAVGIPRGVMGNSEVGHNALGSGQIIKQGIAKVEDYFVSGKIFLSEGWKKAIERTKKGGTLHFSGIFSDGGVHSDIKHLKKLIEEADKEGVQKIRVHCVFDGRDVAPQSEPKYIEEIEEFFAKFRGRDYKIASGGGRMVFVADRYMADWGIVKKGWDAMVRGKAEGYYRDAKTAVKEARKKSPKIQDQYLPSFVIVDEKNKPVGKIEEGDAIIYTDFRADRAIEIAMAFTYEDFPYFQRGTAGNRRPDILFVGMTEYNSDTHVPQYQLVPPVEISQTLNQVVAKAGMTQLAVAETVKFGHITYYYNGNSYKKAKGEKQIEIPSDTRPFNEIPWMKSAETADVVVENLEKYKFVRLNFPGGDMVGHFGEIEPTIVSMEAIDLALSRIAKEVDRLGGMMIVTADHGNAEELLDSEGKPKTSHTTNLVPCIFYDNTKNKNKYKSNKLPDAGISNMAATVAKLLGIDDREIPGVWRESLIG